MSSLEDIISARLRRDLKYNVRKFPALPLFLIVACLYSATVEKMTRRELEQRLKDDGIRRERIGTASKVVSGNNKKYFIVPDEENWEQVSVYDISGSVTRVDVDVTRGYICRNKSFVDVNRSSTTSRSLAKFLYRYHADRVVDGIDLADINDLSDGSSLVRYGRTYTWNDPPPNTELNDLFAFRRELYEKRCSRETAVNVIRRAPTGDVNGDVATLLMLVRDTTSEQAECNNTFRQHMSEQTEHLNGHVERTLRFHEKMDQRVTAVEGMVQQQGRHIEQINHNVTVVQGTVQQQGRHLQQIDHDVTDVQGTVQQHDRQLQQVMREVDDLREAYRTLNGRLDSEEATIERERVVDDNQDARKPSGFDVEERFSGLEKLLPEPGKGGFMEKASSFFYGKKVIVGKEFSCSCHTRADIVSLVKSFGGIVFKNVVAGSALLLAGPNEKNRIEAANNKGVEVITALGDLLNRLKEPEETRHETPAQSRSSNSRSADDISGTNTNDVEVKVSRDEENYDDIGEQDEVELERDGYCDDCLRYWDEGNRDCYTQGCRGNLSGRPWHPPGY